MKARVPGIYRVYSFRGKAPIIGRLRAHIKRLGWSYQKLADETGHPYSTLWQLFEGQTKNPQFATLARIAIVLGVPDLPMTEEQRKLRLIQGGKRKAA